MAVLAPRLLTDEEAAAYLSMPVATVRKAGWGRVCMGRFIRYDRVAIDAILDREAGLAPQSPPAAQEAAVDDAEAAFDRSFPKPA